MKGSMKRGLARLVISVLFVGMISTGHDTVSRADSKSVPMEKTAQSGYGLNNPRTDGDGVVTWDCVYFGNYWQEDTNGNGKVDQEDEKQPIKWRVLSVDGEDAFLLADKNIGCRPYNTEYEDVTWETCTLRSWLNGYEAEKNAARENYSGKGFLDDAFTSEEKSFIKKTAVVNDDNPVYGTEGGNDTLDQVYLLSIDESMNPVYGFTSDDDSTETRKSEKGWWLRTLGYGSNYTACVGNSGIVSRYGGGVSYDDIAVRPALHLNLSFDSGWSYAGIVTSGGGETKRPVETPREFSGKLKSPTTDGAGVTTWDSIYFGSYWQEDTNGDGKADQNDEKQPIRWRVLSADGDDVFLLADKNLDCQWYNTKNERVTWETCTLRSWLNGYGAEENTAGENYRGKGFLNDAFTSEEKSSIKKTVVVNDDNPVYNIEGGNNTSDQVYLLSIDESMNLAYGFPSDNDSTGTRKTQTTAYARRQGVSTGGRPENYGYWWLRSPGNVSRTAAFVFRYGDVSQIGYGVNCDYCNVGVRPALHLNLASDSSWSYAGIVTSGGGEIMLPVETPGKFGGKLNSPVTDSVGVTTWDSIYFGSYWQEDTNGDGKADKNDEKQPIKWRVLSVDGDDVFLLADKNLDCWPYNTEYEDVAWEKCTLRSRLNGYGLEGNTTGEDYSGKGFLDDAFTPEEKSSIKKTIVVNDDNSVYGTEGGNDTSDQVYLLSIDENMNPAYGFSSDDNSTETRKAQVTAYARRQGVSTVGRPGNYGYWWLRSPGDGSSAAAIVSSYGSVGQDGLGVINNNVGVRPALHLNLLSTSSWLYAGTVTSGGRGTETSKPSPTPGTEITPVPPEVVASTKPEVSPSPAESQKPEVSSSAKPTPTPGTEITPDPPEAVASTKPEVSPVPQSSSNPADDPNRTTTPKPVNSPAVPVQTEATVTNTPGEKVSPAGTVWKDDKSRVSYKVIAAGKTAAFYKAENKAAKKIVVPDSVTIDGIKYKVTAVSDQAFSGCKKLRAVTIGKNVTSIGKKAFYGCSKLKSITIKSNKLKSGSVGAKAFKGIHNKAVIQTPKKQKKAYQKWLRKKGATKTVKIK